MFTKVIMKSIFDTIDVTLSKGIAKKFRKNNAERTQKEIAFLEPTFMKFCMHVATTSSVRERKIK